MSRPADMAGWQQTKAADPKGADAVKNNAGRQPIGDDVIYSREQTAKRQILAEVKQREAVKRISVKYESGRVGLRTTNQMADKPETISGGDKTNADSVTGNENAENVVDIKPMSRYSEHRVSYIESNDVEILQLPEKEYSNVIGAVLNSVSCNDSKHHRPGSATSGYRSGGLSDAASEISVKTVSSSSSGVSSSVGSAATTATTTPETVALSEHEIAQVELFYQSHKTEVHVCRCMANLYFGNVAQKLVKEPDWKLYATGIPVLVLDSGFHHRVRRLYFLIAERGTGFVLWKDVLDNLSNYSAPLANFHSLKVSTDHTKLAGVSFDEKSPASDFHHAYERFTGNPNDDLMKLSSQRVVVSKKEKRKSKYRGPKKAEISQPCCFVHMTTIQKPEIAPICVPEDFSSDNNFLENRNEDDPSLSQKNTFSDANTKYSVPDGKYSSADILASVPNSSGPDYSRNDNNPVSFSTEI